MTFTITARCENTGMFGIAICTAIPCVGAFTNYFKPEVGAIAVTGLVDPYIGFSGIKMMSEGMTASEVKENLLKDRTDLSKRQFAIVDKHGNTEAFTSSDCSDHKSQVCKKNFVVTANMMVDETTVNNMVLSFESSAGKELAERLLLALEAGNATPGDKRGRQSASLQVIYKDDFKYRDFRVDVHETPVEELRRIYEIGKKQIFPLLSLMSRHEEIRGPALKEFGARPSILLKRVDEREKIISKF